MSNKTPTIKGIFVKSHIKRVRQEKGEEGIRELEHRFGKSLNFGNLENVPIRDEITLIEHALDIISDAPVPPEKRAFEAGRLHFKNFSTTPLGKIMLSVFQNPGKVFLRTKFVAQQVFKGVTFTSMQLADDKIKIIMKGGDYSIDHFKGLWSEWLNLSGFEPKVEANVLGERRHEYIITLKKKPSRS